MRSLHFFLTANNLKIFKVPMTPDTESKSLSMASYCFSNSPVSSTLCFKWHVYLSRFLCFMKAFPVIHNWLFHFKYSCSPQKPHQTGSMPTMSLPPQWHGHLRKDRIPASLLSESKNWAALFEIDRTTGVNFGNWYDINTSSYLL